MLATLHQQARLPSDIVVADVGSPDKTLQPAHQTGACVVTGGQPGADYDAGICVDKSDLMLFLDANVLPAPDFLA